MPLPRIEDFTRVLSKGLSRRALVRGTLGSGGAAVTAAGLSQAAVDALPALDEGEPVLREFVLTASEFDWELMAGHHGPGLGLQRPDAGSGDPGARRRSGPGHAAQRAAGADDDPLAWRQRAPGDGRSGRAQPGAGRAGRRVRLRVHGHAGRQPLVPLPHRSRGAGPARPLRSVHRRAAQSPADLRPRLHLLLGGVGPGADARRSPRAPLRAGQATRCCAAASWAPTSS